MQACIPQPQLDVCMHAVLLYCMLTLHSQLSACSRLLWLLIYVLPFDCVQEE